MAADLAVPRKLNPKSGSRKKSRSNLTYTTDFSKSQELDVSGTYESG